MGARHVREAAEVDCVGEAIPAGSEGPVAARRRAEGVADRNGAPIGKAMAIRETPALEECALISTARPLFTPEVQTSLPRVSTPDAALESPDARNSKASRTCVTAPVPLRPAALRSIPQRESPKSQAQERWKMRPAG